MKLVVLDKITYIENRFEVLHSYLIHGVTTNKLNTHNFDDNYHGSLEISKGGHVWPEIFLPSSDIVVSLKIWEIIKKFAWFDFRPVKFKKLLNLNYEIGDLSYYDRPDVKRNPNRYRTDKIFEVFPDDPKLHQGQETNYRELVCPIPGRVAPDPDSLIELPVQLKNCTPYPVYYNHKVAENYPIFGCGPIVMHRSVFDSISPFIDPEYFSFCEVEI